MRAKLIIICCIFWIVSLQGEEPKKYNVIFEAANEAQIEDWGSKAGTGLRVLKFKEGGKEILVLLVDTGSGLSLEDIYVFHLEKGRWYLCLMRPTNDRVDVENADGALLFKSNKKLLVQLPIDSIRYFRD